MISGVKWMFRCRSAGASSIAPPYYDGLMSGSVLQELAQPLQAAVAAAGGEAEPVRLDRPADASHGDYASAVALALAKPMKAAPRQIAERIVEQLHSPWIEGAEVAGPGFINLRLQPGWYGHVVERVLDEGVRF